MKTVLSALRNAWGRFNTDNGWAKASHVAMSMMLALFPFCIFALSLAVQVSSGIETDDLIALVYGAWPDQIAEPITREVRAVLDQSGPRTTIVGALLAIFFASNGVDAVRAVVTDAFFDQDTRPLWRQRAISVLFVLVGSLLVAVAGGAIIGLSARGQSLASGDPPRIAITLVLLFFAVYASHAWLGGVRHSAREVLPGVILTLLLWMIAGYGFSFYFSNFSTYSMTYAGLAGVMAALVFLYLMAAIFVICAEFNGQLIPHRCT